MPVRFWKFKSKSQATTPGFHYTSLLQNVDPEPLPNNNNNNDNHNNKHIMNAMIHNNTTTTTTTTTTNNENNNTSSSNDNPWFSGIAEGRVLLGPPRGRCLLLHYTYK